MTTPRHGTTATTDKTYNALGMTLHHEDVTYAATIALTPNARESVYVIGALTGAATINLTVSSSSAGDVIQFIGSASGADRIVTLGTGISAATITVPSGDSFSWRGRFNGTAFVEESRGQERPQHYHEAVAFATTIALTPDAKESTYVIAAATGNPTINITTSSSVEGDIITLLGVASGGTRTVTPGTNTAHTGALSVADTKYYSWTGKFDGTVFIEQSQAIQA